MRKGQIFVLGISLCLLLPAREKGLAKVQTQREKTQLTHEVVVTLKLVHVYVTDKKGNPVLDLTRDDFVLSDNGRKQTVTEFEKHVLSFPSPGVEDKQEIIKETPLQAPQELMNRKFFLFFDLAFNNAKGISKAKEAALHFLDTQLHPSDELGVFSYSAIKSLKLHEYLTIDHKKIRKIVSRFGIKDMAGGAEDFETEYWQAITGETPEDASQAGWVFKKPDPGIISTKQKEGLVQILHFAQKMTDLARALRYIPGPKYIIFFSSGVPHSFIYGIQSPFGIPANYATGENLGRWGEPLLKERYEDMLKELSASNCTIYTLDTEELKRTIEADSRMTGAFSLEKMASATGGKYFGNINEYEQHLDKIRNLTGAYYVLGYYISEAWDGAYHKIKVEVKRPGCNVHAQKGYFSPKPFQEYTDLERMLHLIDLALSEKPVFQTPLRFPLEALPCPEVKKANLCLMGKIPRDEVQDILGGKVEIFSLIFDSAENIVELRREEEDSSRLPGNNLYYYSFFSLPPGQYKCRLIIRNLKTGRGAVGTSTASILERKEKVIELYPPLLLYPDKNAAYRRGPLPRKSDQNSANLTLSDYFLFDPTQYSPCLEEAWPKNSTVPAVAAGSILGISAPKVEISAYLVEKVTGESFPLDISVVSETKEGEMMIFFLNIEIPEMEPGEYTLNLFAVEKTSKSLSQVTKGFRIM